MDKNGKVDVVMINPLRGILRALAVNNGAATAIEYSLIAALIAIVIVGALTLVGDGVSGMFDMVAGAFG